MVPQRAQIVEPSSYGAEPQGSHTTKPDAHDTSRSDTRIRSAAALMAAVGIVLIVAPLAAGVPSDAALACGLIGATAVLIAVGVVVAARRLPAPWTGVLPPLATLLVTAAANDWRRSRRAAFSVAERPYRSARAPDDALAECRTHAGGRFDGVCVEALARLVAAGALPGTSAATHA